MQADIEFYIEKENYFILNNFVLNNILITIHNTNHSRVFEIALIVIIY